MTLLADLARRGDVNDVVWILLVVLALVAAGVAVWRAYLRDGFGTLLAGVVALVLLVLLF